MKIIHRLSLSNKQDKQLLKKLTKLGLEPFETGGKLFPNMCYFDISEDEPVWPQVSQIIEKNKILNIPRVEFTIEEVLSAKWVRIHPVYFVGEDYSFPEPHLDDTWKRLSFDYKNECSQCGAGLHQKAPIHLKDEPEMEENHFMGIFWTYDIFSLNEVLEVLLEKGITGFEPYPAIHYKKKVPLTTIKQLKITGELAQGLINANVKSEIYPCGHVKYIGLCRGMYKFSQDIFKNIPDLAKTYEWFGSGHMAVRSILASAKFVKVYIENDWKGLSLEPIELV